RLTEPHRPAPTSSTVQLLMKDANESTQTPCVSSRPWVCHPIVARSLKTPFGGQASLYGLRTRVRLGADTSARFTDFSLIGILYWPPIHYGSLLRHRTPIGPPHRTIGKVDQSRPIPSLISQLPHHVRCKPAALLENVHIAQV